MSVVRSPSMKISIAPKHLANAAYTKTLTKVKKYQKACNHCCSKGRGWSFELDLCSIVAGIGALVVTVIVLRSLYLLYTKPEGT
ncbi:unnamed protein product [Leptosia nina]|uniref:Uncharacterized protein n=1 Tax=Leptosia nina TaxID=320188 RepID=A0AAV1IXV9_9NEOP